MPKIDGMTMLKKLREDAWGKSVPVVILTNVDPDSQDLEDIVEYGASYCLIKTRTSLDSVVNNIQELLKR